MRSLGVGGGCGCWGVRLDSVQKQEDNAPYKDSDFYQFSLIPYSKKTCIVRY